MLKRVKSNKLLLLILIFAFALRVNGLDHGLPKVYHPDEPAVVRSAFGIMFNPNPGHFDWPHLFFYINYFAYMVFSEIRAILENAGLRNLTQLKILWEEPSIFYIISRFLSAVFGTLTIVPLYLTVKKLFADKHAEAVALLTSLSLAVLPFHVRYSHYALLEAPMLFFLTTSGYFLLSASKDRVPRNYALAGLFLGLAMSTKYNAFLGGLMLIPALLHGKQYKEKLFGVLFFALTALLGFFAGTPYALLDSQTFLRNDSPKGALWQFTNVGRVEGRYYPPQLIFVLVEKLPKDFGFSLWILFAISTIILIYTAIFKRHTLDRSHIFILLSMAVIFYVSSFEKYRSHYFFPGYVFFLLTIAHAHKLTEQKIQRKVTLFLYMLIFSIPLTISILETQELKTRTGKDYSGVVKVK